ncbi:restriction endonuclease subunit S [Sphaerochaeta sp. UBA5849]|jgi:type I restriction enzyme S subunit|uniref:restriction endonuclease subunit S n=1 Tax=Sphaerochaeta sp. UBA5849 TaxID=1947475 RepID=UPI002AA731CE|nr:restriction endonuclease subunit S [uncultured Sphaerochaeta sp.]
MTSKLSDLCALADGRVAVAELDMDTYISTENMLPNKEGITRSAGLPTANQTQAYQVDDVLVSNIRPYFKKIWYADRYGGCSNDVLVLRAKDVCIPRFLYYLLSDDNYFDYATATAKGTKMPRGDKGAIMRYEVPDLPIGVQIGIADTLSALDARIAINRAINNHLEQLAHTIFKSSFVDYEPTKPFTEVVQVLGGGTPKTTKTEYWDGSIPFFTPKDTQSLYILTTEKTLTEEGLSKCNSRLYPVNTVFVTARGTVGKLAIAGVPMAMNQSCYALVGNNGYGQHFVYHLALETVEHLKHKASGAVFDAIVTRDFESEMVAVPPIDAVNEFEKNVKPIYEALLNNAKESFRLSSLRNSLLPKLMSGELTIADSGDTK